MKINKKFFFFFIITLLSPLMTNSALASDFYCNGKIVSTGDRISEVYYKCGEPDWKDIRTEEVIRQLGEDHWVKRLVDVEEWIYNLGPTRFIRILKFVNNRLKDIQTMDYGYSGSDFRSTEDCLDTVDLGNRMPEILVKCGYPSFTNRYQEEHLKKLKSGKLIRFQVIVSEWIYNFGPRRFIRALIFENGKLVKVEKRDYGFEDR